MNRKLTAGLLLVTLFTVTLVASVGAVAAPYATTIEDFEYAGDSAFQAAWEVDLGAPTRALSAVAHGGARSMSFTYDVSDAFPLESVRREFDPPLDLSDLTDLTIWHQGLAANGRDGLYLALYEGASAVLEAGQVATTDELGWLPWTIDLTAASDTPDAVTAIVLGVENIGSPGSSGAGTVYFDDLSVSNGLETVWLGNTTTWSSAGNWDSGVPTGTTNARIPSVPSGANFPVLLGGSANVHDLVIEPGATLDFDVHELQVAGTLTNLGSITQRKAVGANASVPFLMAGGHSGVRIETPASFLDASPSAPAFLTAGLGETAVTIDGGQSCASSGDTVLRCFTVTPASSSGTAISLTFYFDHEELNAQDCSALSAFNWHNGGWVAAGTVSQRQCATAPYSITVAGVTEFSPFVLAENEPLAIGLHSFGAAPALSPLPAVVALAALLLLLALSALRLGDRLWSLGRRLTGL